MTYNSDFDFKALVKLSNSDSVKHSLLHALARAESSLNPYAARFEPNWSYHYNVGFWAKKLGITRATEHTFQATSWGLMQVMGTVARELGFDRHLTELVNPEYNVIIAIRKLDLLFEKYGKLTDVISAYNQGWPKKNADGTYANQRYVDKVLGFVHSSFP